MVGGPASPDYARAMAFSSDGSYVIGGHSSNEGGYGAPDDIVVVKLSSAGSEEWTKILGGSEIDYARRMISLKEGGFLVCGYTDSFS